ncbi:MAG TPA: hypothetical protein VE377_23435 [Candidatus Dormibacteraeota bacterium]|nr:hypothetical protein [Candidatus Dormibacteraeota bacterium]
MSSTNRRFIVAYILLVGLPLVGLAGVLKTGRALNAPISIDGVWKLDAPASHPVSQSCDQAVSALLASSLLVSQSGKSLALTFNGASKTAFSGELEGRNIKASIGPVSGCVNEQPVMLAASVDPKSEPKLLTGSLTVSNCASCSPVEFRAVRQPRPQSAGGAH